MNGDGQEPTAPQPVDAATNDALNSLANFARIISPPPNASSLEKFQGEIVRDTPLPIALEHMVRGVGDEVDKKTKEYLLIVAVILVAGLAVYYTIRK